MNLKQSVQIGAAALALSACGDDPEKPTVPTPECSQEVGNVIEGGTVETLADGVAARMSFKLLDAVDKCFKAEAFSPYYVGFKGNAVGQMDGEDGDPLAGETAGTVGWSSRYYGLTHEVNVPKKKWDVATFPLGAGALPDLEGEHTVNSTVLTDGEICILIQNPGSPRDAGYADKFDALSMGCSAAKVIISEGTSSATGQEAPTEQQQEDQNEEHNVTGAEVDPGDL